MNSSSYSLKGMNVLIPRGEKQAKSFSDLVLGYGGIPVEIPLIAFRPAKTRNDLLEIIKLLHTYDWIIFTSNVTIETFFSFFNLSSKTRLPRIAAIGEKTKSILLEKGVQVDFTPQEYVAEGFVEEFLPFIKKGMKVLIPKGNLARDYICTALIEEGALVEEVIVYETFFPEESQRILKQKLAANELDIVPFTSPSTVDHLMDTVKRENLHASIKRCIIGCIGPITKDRAEAYGLNVHAVPEVYTVHNMLKSIMAYLEINSRREN